MNEGKRRPWIIAVSFVVAMMLAIVPMPDWARPLRPEWVAMTVIYWSMALPRMVSVGVGWFVGLLMDVLKGALLGQHAFGYVIVAYLSARFHQRVRVFPLWQQAVSVGLMLFPYMLLSLWVDGLIDRSPGTWLYWAPLATSVLLWPWVFLFLRQVRRQAKLA